MSDAITIHLHGVLWPPPTGHTLEITPTNKVYTTREPAEWSCLRVSCMQPHTIEDECDTTNLVWVCVSITSGAGSEHTDGNMRARTHEQISDTDSVLLTD